MAEKKTKKKIENETAKEMEELVKELPGDEEVILDLNVNPEGDDKIPLDPETGLDPEKLESELNDLKDLVQGEIDKMMEENPDSDWKEIVKEAKEGKANRGKGKDAKLCECCGENEVEDDEIYCPECLETMRHYPFVWWKVLIPILAIALVILSFSYFAISFPVYQETVSANKLAKAGKLNSALAAYDKINAEIKVTDENFGNRYLKYQIAINDRLGIDAYENLNDFIDKHFTGSDLKKFYNKSVREEKAKIESYQKLYDVFSDAYGASKNYAEFIEEFDNRLKDKDFDKAQVYYYKYYAANILGEDISVMRENVEKIREVDPNAKSLYLPLLAEISLNDQKYDDMLKYANELSKFNSESPYVYLYRAIAYRLQGDLDNANKACDTGLKIDSTNTLLNYQKAVVCLLKDKQSEAYSYACTAYEKADTANSYLAAASLYSLCAQLEGETEVNEAIIEEVSQYGYGFANEVQQVIDGELTIKDLFTKGKGDFTWG